MAVDTIARMMALDAAQQGGSGTVDQTYTPTSENAQSGTAVAEALETIPSVTVDQTFDPVSANAQSGVAVQEALQNIPAPQYELKQVTNAVNFPANTQTGAIANLQPLESITSDKLYFLRVYYNGSYVLYPIQIGTSSSTATSVSCFDPNTGTFIASIKRSTLSSDNLLFQLTTTTPLAQILNIALFAYP